eukprot:3120650-Rhodomonas_salina.2
MLRAVLKIEYGWQEARGVREAALQKATLPPGQSALARIPVLFPSSVLFYPISVLLPIYRTPILFLSTAVGAALPIHPIQSQNIAVLVQKCAEVRNWGTIYGYTEVGYRSTGVGYGSTEIR